MTLCTLMGSFGATCCLTVWIWGQQVFLKNL